MNDAIVASDKEYHLTAWNSAAESMYGWKADVVLGRNGLEVMQTEFPGADGMTIERLIEVIQATSTGEI